MTRHLLRLALFLLALGTAVPAWAEEVFVLENGSVVRGRIVRHEADSIVVRLSGFATENRITIRNSEIVRQYTAVDPKRRPGDQPLIDDPVVPAAMSTSQDGVPRTVLLAPDLIGSRRGPDGEVLPTGEVAIEKEGFFGRLQRKAVLATPSTIEGRVLLGVLLLIVMTVIVAGGTRLLGMKAASLHASTSLGLLLGVFLVTDILFSETLLRADRALWVVPLQVGIWLFVARSTLDAPLSRTVPLLAVVLFAATSFVFAVGSVLVAA